MATPGVSLYVNADWSALVPAGSPEAAFGIAPIDAKRLGLMPAEGETFAPPQTIASANEPAEPAADDGADLEPSEPEAEPVAEPEAKQAPKPANKAARKPRTK